MANKEDENLEDDRSEESETLENQKQNVIKLFVKPLLGGQTFEIEVSKKSTISSVKETLENQYEVDTLRQILVYHDKQLPDDQTIEACGVQNNSTLYMIPKMRSGPLNYRVNTRAVEEYMKDIDKEIQEAMVKVGDKTGYPVKNDDVYILTIDSKGELKIVRVTNTEKPKAVEIVETPNANEIKLETWDRMGENQQTRSRMADIQRKMKASKEEKEKRHKRKTVGKRRHEKTNTPKQLAKHAMLDSLSLEQQKSVDTSLKTEERPVIKIRKILPPSSNVIRGEFQSAKSSASQEDWNNSEMWSVSAEDSDDKSYTVMEEYEKKDSDSFEDTR